MDTYQTLQKTKQLATCIYRYNSSKAAVSKKLHSTLQCCISTLFCHGTLLSFTLMMYSGLLESVSNLTVTPLNSTTILIFWSPPFTLEGVPILGYNVTITNTTSGENETMLVEDTTLLYSIDHPDPGNNFTVTVVPINEVGTGEPNYVKSTQISPLHKDEISPLITTQATFPLNGEKTNTYLGIVSIIKLILLKHASFKIHSIVDKNSIIYR